jgi:predicted YcjX-like family ATPase
MAADLFSETTLKIAITGLSRSGKTVFLTSLIANLLALGQTGGGGRNTLPAFTARLAARGMAGAPKIRLVPAGAETVPRFDVAAKLRALADPLPHWPDRTEDIALLALELMLPRAGPFGTRLPPRRLVLEFLDYPGEWLLDMPLLAQDFSTWSRETLGRLRGPSHAPCCAEFLAYLDAFDPAQPADDETIRRGHLLYRDALLRLRAERGFRLLQPGRFLCPGPRGDAPYLWFYPIEAEGGAGSGGALLQSRFEAYKAELRGHFFATRFLEFDRQIVLVDVLSALHAGEPAFADTAQAIADIARAYSYGGNGLFEQMMRWGEWLLGSRLPFRRVERVVFVATKADHLPALLRPRLPALLRDMVSAGVTPMAAAASGIQYRGAAAVLSTRDGQDWLGGQLVDVVIGVPPEGGPARGFYAGEIPSRRPDAEWWQHPYFELPAFRPPVIQADGTLGIPHLGLDEVLVDLIGDRL